MDQLRSSGRCPEIGDVYMVDFRGSDSEQCGFRPALVFSNNRGNTHSPNVIVLPLTSSVKKQSQPTHVLLRAAETGLLKDSMVLCENPACVSKSRLKQYVTKIPTVQLRQVAEASMLATSAPAFLDLPSFARIRDLAISFNRPLSRS